MRNKGHYMSVIPLWLGFRYVTCTVPGCHRVLRAWDLKPLMHNGRKPR